jgi:hypothetical protein
MASPCSIADCDTLVTQLDQQFQKCKEWTGSIPFKVMPGFKQGPPCDLHEYDICSFLGGKTVYERLYFPAKTYPPPSESNPQGSISKIVVDLHSAAYYASATYLKSDGSRLPGGHDRVLVCSCYTRSATSAATNEDHSSKKQDDTPPCRKFRASSLVGDVKYNVRPNGKSLPRRTYRQRTSCTFRLHVKYERNPNIQLYYIELARGAGCPNHNDHPQPDKQSVALPMRIMDPTELKLMKEMSEAGLGPSAGRNYLLQKTGRLVSSCKVHWFMNGNDSLDPTRSGKKKVDEVQDLLDSLESNKETKYTILCDTPCSLCKLPSARSTVAPPLSSRLVSTSRDSATSSSNSEKDLTENTDLSDIVKKAQMTRLEQGLDADTKIFIAIGWVYKCDYRLFQLFPEVVHVDGTSHSTNSKYQLYTFSVRSSLNKQVVFMRMWLPNEQKSTFRLVFGYMVRQLLPPDALGRVRVIMADGDPQQKEEILNSFKFVFPNAVFGGCGWHIVFQGWIRYGPSLNQFRGRQRTLAKRLYRNVKRWCYSWMKTGYCETEEEYKISKALLVAYLSSDAVLKALGGGEKAHCVVAELRAYVLKRVADYEKEYSFWRKKNIRCFNIFHNSCHEGTNNGAKSHAAPILPNQNMRTSANSLGLQSNLKGLGHNVDAIMMLSKSCEWSSSPSCDDLVPLAEGILQGHHRRWKEYTCRRVGNSNFEVSYIGQDSLPSTVPDSVDLSYSNKDLEVEEGYNTGSEEEEDCDSNDSAHFEDAAAAATSSPSTTTGGDKGLIDNDPMGGDPSSLDTLMPLFNRVRKINVAVDGSMQCGCDEFERSGIPCVHMHVLSKYVDPDWKGFSKTDVDIRWWLLYLVYGCYSDVPGSEEMSPILEQLRLSKMRPMLRVTEDSLALIPIEEPTVEQEIQFRVKNYSPNDILHVLSNPIYYGLSSKTYEPPGFDISPSRGSSSSASPYSLSSSPSSGVRSSGPELSYSPSSPVLDNNCQLASDPVAFSQSLLQDDVDCSKASTTTPSRLILAADVNDFASALDGLKRVDPGMYQQHLEKFHKTLSALSTSARARIAASDTPSPGESEHRSYVLMNPETNAHQKRTHNTHSMPGSSHACRPKKPRLLLFKEK